MYNNIQTLDKYIESLILNINKDNIPPEIDVCFDGGAFNGVYAWGISRYLIALEKAKLTKVKRISGASVGAIIGLFYIINNDSIDLNQLFIDMCTSFKKDYNLSNLKYMLKKIIYKEFKNNDMSKINNKLFINYYDTKKHCNVLVSKYKNKKQLLNYIIYSSFVPLLFDGNLKYKDRYIDGLMCHIFIDNIRPKLFVRLISFKHIFKTIQIKYDKNIYNRLIIGVVDANNFFINGDSDMCCFIKYNWIYLLEQNIREFFVLFFIYSINMLSSLNLPKYFNNIIYIDILNIFKKHIHDCIF